MSEELKPCPFCGNKAELFCTKGTEDWAVVCQHPECGCNARILYCDTKEEAIEQWNRRTSDPEKQKLVEALEDARTELAYLLETRTDMPGRTGSVFARLSMLLRRPEEKP